jgi:hypothetical protein
MGEDGAADSDIWPADPGGLPHVIAILSVHTHGAVHDNQFDSVPLAPGIRGIRIPTCFGDTCPRSGPDEVGNCSRRYADRSQGYHI